MIQNNTKSSNKSKQVIAHMLSADLYIHPKRQCSVIAGGKNSREDQLSIRTYRYTKCTYNANIRSAHSFFFNFFNTCSRLTPL